MPKRRIPTHPNVDRLRNEAKTMLTRYRQRDPEAIADFERFNPHDISPDNAQLSDAQLTLARSYDYPSWPRLISGATLCRAIHEGDLTTIEQVIRDQPFLLNEGLRGQTTLATWGTPVKAATALKNQDVVDLLVRLTGVDQETAMAQAISHGLEQLWDWSTDDHGNPLPGAIMHPCEMVDDVNMRFLLSRGVEISDEHGDRYAPVGIILQTYGRNPLGKHGCLQLCIEHGLELPDTPMMAFHRGRIDLLEAHLKRDPGMLTRCWTSEDIFPTRYGCRSEPEGAGLCGTPVIGGTLLHLCGEYGEVDIARWLLDQGADPNIPAAVDSDGFGGQTPLFNCMVTLERSNAGRIARMLLDAGADVHATANMRKQLLFAPDETMHKYPNVTPLEWGEKFHAPNIVSRDVMKLIRAKIG